VHARARRHGWSAGQASATLAVLRIWYTTAILTDPDLGMPGESVKVRQPSRACCPGTRASARTTRGSAQPTARSATTTGSCGRGVPSPAAGRSR
jgi:hypothetical protein